MPMLSELTLIQKLLVQVSIACLRDRCPAFRASLNSCTLDLTSPFPGHRLRLGSTNGVAQPFWETALHLTIAFKLKPTLAVWCTR